MKTPVISFTFHGDLAALARKGRQWPTHDYSLIRRASVKDIIESLAIPHTEIGRIVCNGREIPFQYIPVGDEKIHLHPFTSATPVRVPTLLRPQPFSAISFMEDDTVRRLGRNMRMAGFDTLSAPDELLGRLADLAAFADRHERILLTRNRELLKCASVRFGQLLRSANHLHQLDEVLSRFGLKRSVQPLSRCLRCNVRLVDISKQTIMHRLEPLTKKYYHAFKICPLCDKIYWHGSHCENMLRFLGETGFFDG